MSSASSASDMSSRASMPAPPLLEAAVIVDKLAPGGTSSPRNSATAGTSSSTGSAGASAGPRVVHISRIRDFVRPGDVLLFKCDNFPSALQRTLTSCEYDHVGIVVDIAWRDRMYLQEELHAARMYASASAGAGMASALSQGTMQSSGTESRAPIPLRQASLHRLGVTSVSSDDYDGVASSTESPRPSPRKPPVARSASAAKFLGISESELAVAAAATAARAQVSSASFEGPPDAFAADYAAPTAAAHAPGGGSDGRSWSPDALEHGAEPAAGGPPSPPWLKSPRSRSGSVSTSSAVAPSLPVFCDLPAPSLPLAASGMAPLTHASASTGSLAASNARLLEAAASHNYTLHILEASGDGVRSYPLIARLQSYGNGYTLKMSVRRLLLPGEEIVALQTTPSPSGSASASGVATSSSAVVSGGIDFVSAAMAFARLRGWAPCCISCSSLQRLSLATESKVSATQGAAPSSNGCPCFHAAIRRLTLERRLGIFMAQVDNLPYRLIGKLAPWQRPAHAVSTHALVVSPRQRPLVRVGGAAAAAGAARASEDRKPLLEQHRPGGAAASPATVADGDAKASSSGSGSSGRKAMRSYSVVALDQAGQQPGGATASPVTTTAGGAAATRATASVTSTRRTSSMRSTPSTGSTTPSAPMLTDVRGAPLPVPQATPADLALVKAIPPARDYYCSELLAAAYMRMGLLPTDAVRSASAINFPLAASLTRPSTYWPNAWCTGGVVDALLPEGSRLDEEVLIDCTTTPLSSAVFRAL